MKKTKHIKLVLITAAMASCNREMTPQRSMIDDPTDDPAIGVPAGSMYAAGPMYSGGSRNATGPADTMRVAGSLYNPGVHDTTFYDCRQEAYLPLWNYSFSPFGHYYVKRFFKIRGLFILRGGWGRAGHSANS
jgi:hypothetical protein